MHRPDSFVGLNSSPKRLQCQVIVEGKKVDPFSGGIVNTDSDFLLQPHEGEGIRFRVGDVVIPYDEHHLEAIDSSLGRMLRIRDDHDTVQIVLVEHLLSALQLLGLTGVEIVLGDACYGSLTSSNVPTFGLRKPTYWIPVVGPGVSGFINRIKPNCTQVKKTPDIINVTRAYFYDMYDSRYNNVHRKMYIEPADKLSIEVLSCEQPDIPNVPYPLPCEVSEGESIDHLLRARPVMRLKNRFQVMVLFFLNLRSFALTRETYFRARPGMTREEVTSRMDPQFQEGAHEHLVHTLVSDFPSELGAFLHGKDLHGKISLWNTTHTFRMKALQKLIPQILGK